MARHREGSEGTVAARRIVTRVACTGLLIAAVIAAAGCESALRTEDWRGKPISDAIATFGTPSTITPTPDGQKVYVWMLHHSGTFYHTSVDGQGMPTEVAVHRDQVTTWTFFVDAKGIITSFNRSDT